MITYIYERSCGYKLIVLYSGLRLETSSSKKYSISWKSCKSDNIQLQPHKFLNLTFEFKLIVITIILITIIYDYIELILIQLTFT